MEIIISLLTVAEILQDFFHLCKFDTEMGPRKSTFTTRSSMVHSPFISIMGQTQQTRWKIRREGGVKAELNYNFQFHRIHFHFLAIKSALIIAKRNLPTASD